MYGALVSDQSETKEESIPNFHSSLDACAEFEKTLTTEKDRRAYKLALVKASTDGKGDWLTQIIATAPQRCEAYLRVKGLWKEDGK